MRGIITLGLVAATLAGCKSREETGQAGEATDTVVTSRQTQDTALVTHDTNITVDTNIKRGDKSTRVDTVKKSQGSNQPSDTTSAR
jgi:hypothetical protein